MHICYGDAEFLARRMEVQSVGRDLLTRFKTDAIHRTWHSLHAGFDGFSVPTLPAPQQYVIADP